jgi:hypothetical protein
MADTSGVEAADPAPAPTVEALIRHRLAVALGGWRGAIETALPTAVFVAVWLWRSDVTVAVIAAGVVVLVLGGLRLVQRGDLKHVGGALLATAIAAWFALRSGRAEDAFLPGILLSATYGVGTLVSIVAGWPLIGFVIGAADPQAQSDPFRWRRDPAIVAVCRRLTWVMVGLFAVRLGVMMPLYLAKNVPALGVAKIVLGWPLWVGAIALMGWLLVRGETPLATSTD